MDHPRKKIAAQIVEALDNFCGGIGSSREVADQILALVEEAVRVAVQLSEERPSLLPTNRQLAECDRLVAGGTPETCFKCGTEPDDPVSSRNPRITLCRNCYVGGAPAVPSEAAIQAAADASGFVNEDEPADSILLRAVAKMLRAAYAVDFGSLAPAPSGPASERKCWYCEECMQTMPAGPMHDCPKDNERRMANRRATLSLEPL